MKPLDVPTYSCGCSVHNGHTCAAVFTQRDYGDESPQCAEPPESIDAYSGCPPCPTGICGFCGKEFALSDVHRGNVMCPWCGAVNDEICAADRAHAKRQKEAESETSLHDTAAYKQAMEDKPLSKTAHARGICAMCDCEFPISNPASDTSFCPRGHGSNTFWAIQRYDSKKCFESSGFVTGVVEYPQPDDVEKITSTPRQVAEKDKWPELRLPDGSAARKELPITTGFLDYFPRAAAYVAKVSRAGNIKHNGPDAPMNWRRGTSDDHADCIPRHLIDRGKRDGMGLRHSGQLAWRAMANLELELEEAEKNGEEW